MKFFVLLPLLALLANCSSLPKNTERERTPASAGFPDDGGATCRMVLPGKPSRPVTADEASITKALMSPDLDDSVFDAVFGAWCHHIRSEVLADFTLFDTVSLDKSTKQPAPILIYASGVNMATTLIAINRNIYFEGFYRNLVYQGNNAQLPEPWLRWDASNKNYVLEKSGAEVQLLKEFLRQPGVVDAAKKVTLYRGTKLNEKTLLVQLQKEAAQAATAPNAVQDANSLAAKLHNGLFSTNILANAKNYAQGPGGVLLTSVLDSKTLADLVQQNFMGTPAQGQSPRALYVGYEYTYFELAFISGDAVLAFSRGLK